VVIWLIVDLFVESSDIAQIAQAMPPAPGTQSSAQNGITAWGLFSHSSKVIALVVYLCIEARRLPPTYLPTSQHVPGSNSSQPTGQDLDVFVQSGGLEMGHFEMDSELIYHFPTPHLRSKPHRTSASHAAIPQPLKQAYAHAPRASSSNDASPAVDNSTASSAPPEQYEMQTFRGHTQLPEEPTRPPPVLTRPHSLPTRFKVINHDSALHALPGQRRGQTRQDIPIDQAITSPTSPVHSPGGLHPTHKHRNNQAALEIPSRDHTGNTVLPTRPLSASPDTEGPPGPVMIRQV
jgi:hypothetical protein